MSAIDVNFWEIFLGITWEKFLKGFPEILIPVHFHSFKTLHILFWMTLGEALKEISLLSGCGTPKKVYRRRDPQHFQGVGMYLRC